MYYPSDPRPYAMSGSTVAPLFTWRSAICESDLTPTVRHVALTLSLYMNERGGSAFPGAERLARETGLGERTVRRDLRTLVDGGWLIVKKRGGRLPGGKGAANEYVASFPKGAGGAPLPEEGCTPPRERVQESADKGARGAGHYSKNSPGSPSAGDTNPYAAINARNEQRLKEDAERDEVIPVEESARKAREVRENLARQRKNGQPVNVGVADTGPSE